MIDETSQTFHHRKKIISIFERNGIGAITTIISFKIVSVFQTTLLISLLALTLIVAHALFRPILHEKNISNKNDKYQNNSSFSADGFLDEGRDETLYFVKDKNNECQKKKALRRRQQGGAKDEKEISYPGLVLPSGGGYERQKHFLKGEGGELHHDGSSLLNDPMKRS
eukprot:CAMPEP_0172522710 /NCGR_PEP_ID=MMETSP1066-20121228/293277_1 /TAXON_ID=671091 /ORGANISM="Coscinodiscus wailesii, Strain CCMP2513" /LENGTH=167 /DNA_ID=CAMNT_0013305741 /DNA_START=445 /DNA_END=948 /DNA_ORIENTATION=+